MNHIYKTILDRNTGVIKAVAENASGHCKSQTKKGQIREVTPISTIKKNKGNIKILSFAVALIFNSLVMTFSHAETYTGDENTLKTSNQVSTQFEQLLNQPNAKGFLGTSVPNANGNKILTIDYASGTTPDFVVLGYAESVGNNQAIETNNNQIILERGDIGGNIYAGLSHYTKRTEAIDCRVNPILCTNRTLIDISDTILNNKFISNQNLVQIDGKDGLQITGDIFSGYSGINLSYGDLIGEDATTSNAFTTAYANASAFATAYANTNTLTANENTISIDGDDNGFNDLVAGYSGINLSYGDLIGGDATATTTTTTTATATAYAYANMNTLTANNNEINVAGNNNTFNDISAGYSGINLSYGDLIGGTISINGNKTEVNSTLTIDTRNTKLYANQNKISLAGSSIISGDIKTGTIDFIIQHGKVEKANGTAGIINISGYLTGTEAFANQNEINIIGEHQFTNPNSVIYGGSLNISEKGYKPTTYDVFTGNTLNYNNSVPIRIKEIGNFQTYNFTLNPALANTNTALITAESVILGSNESNSSAPQTKAVASDIKVVGIQSGQLVSTGSQFILMQADAGKLIGSGQGYISNGVAQQGISLLYNVETKVDQANNQVIAVINSSYESSTGPTVNPQLKSLLEGSLSGATLLNTSSDQLSNQLYSSIRSQSNQSNPNGQALFSPFAMMSGNHSRNNSGSYIKSNGTALTVGLGVQLEQFTGGIFIENGWDSYKTFNGFNNADDVNGKGHNRFNGLGLYGHYDFNNQFYSDVMVRAGRLKTHFETDDLINISTGERTAYDLKNNYYGASLKGGYLWSINTRNELDLSAQYAWTGTESRDLIVSGDPLHFDKMTSQRVILNAENNYKLTPQLTLLTGLGYEYEFDGKSKGTTYNAFNIDNPSMQGSTTLASLGLRYEPSHHRNLSLDFHGNGYYGKREGGSVGLKLNYIF